MLLLGSRGVSESSGRHQGAAVGAVAAGPRAKKAALPIGWLRCQRPVARPNRGRGACARCSAPRRKGSARTCNGCAGKDRPAFRPPHGRTAGRCAGGRQSRAGLPDSQESPLRRCIRLRTNGQPAPSRWERHYPRRATRPLAGLPARCPSRLHQLGGVRPQPSHADEQPCRLCALRSPRRCSARRRGPAAVPSPVRTLRPSHESPLRPGAAGPQRACAPLLPLRGGSHPLRSEDLPKRAR